MPVTAAAVAVYVTFPAPWHLVDVAPKANTGVPTFDVTSNTATADWAEEHVYPEEPLIITS